MVSESELQWNHTGVYDFYLFHSRYSKAAVTSIRTVLIGMLILFSCPGYLKEQVLQWFAGKHRAETHLKKINQKAKVTQ